MQPEDGSNQVSEIFASSFVPLQLVCPHEACFKHELSFSLQESLMRCISRASQVSDWAKSIQVHDFVVRVELYFEALNGGAPEDLVFLGFTSEGRRRPELRVAFFELLNGD